MDQGVASRLVAMMDFKTLRKAMSIVAVLRAMTARMVAAASMPLTVSAVFAAMACAFLASTMYRMPTKPISTAAAADVTHVTTRLAANNRLTAYPLFALNQGAFPAATGFRTVWKVTSTVVDLTVKHAAMVSSVSSMKIVPPDNARPMAGASLVRMGFSTDRRSKQTAAV